MNSSPIAQRGILMKIRLLTPVWLTSFMLFTALVGFASLVGANEGSLAFVGATLIDGTDAEPLEDSVIVITDGRIRTVGPRDSVTVPDGTMVIDASGKTIMPGIVNAHAHVGGTLGLSTGNYNTENLTRQLRLYARYGVTTVASLGG
ncbi:MAG: cytosine/adenosine deaminase-related metal-dependent hydrolase, partial [Pseudohongiellaceae bacterium]